MSLESVFKLSLIMNLIDNLTEPMSRVSSAAGGSISKLQSMEQTLGGMTKGGAVMAGVGMQITDAALAPVEATFETRRALGELSSLGVKDLGALEDAARSFSDQWAGTSKADFISAAYDIKSGIASLSDEGVAQYTELAGVTAKATKSTIGQMTDLFATGYGIYKDFYGDLSDMEFGEMFSAGIATSVKQFKTDGSQMAGAIKTLGASATTAQVPLEEQLSVLGMLQATMSGAEAGTKYKAFLRSATKGGEALGLSFTDANNQLLSMPEILEQLRGKFGETMDAAEKMELQKAFGDTEAVALIDLMYNKTGDLQDNILSLYDSMGGGIGVATEMATAINETEPEKFQRLQQQIHNVTEDLGNSLLPTVNTVMGKVGEFIAKGAEWVQSHQELVRVIMLVVLCLGGFLTVAGSVIAVVGGVGLVFTKTAGFVTGFIGTIKKLPGMLDTVRIYGMYAGDGIKKGFSYIKSAGAGAINGIKNVALSMANMAKTAAISGVNALKSMATGLVGMAKQAIATASTALGPLISSVWSFTAALLANPITWVVIAIVGLIAGLVLLYNKCEWFRNLVDGIISGIKEKLGAAFAFVKNIFGAIGNVIGKVMGAAKATVEEKLGNMKRAYEEHGGGIKGVAAAAVEGVKGYYTAGFTFLDNLTGGKLSAITSKVSAKFDEIKNTVSEKMSAVKQHFSDRLSDMKSAYEEHGGGLKGAAAAALEGVRGAYQDGFNAIDNLTGGKLSAITSKVSAKFDEIKNTVSEKMSAVKQHFSDRLSDMKSAYEEHGGGLKGAAAAALEGVRGAYEDKFNAIDNLTGGKLSAITSKVSEKFSEIKNTVSSAMEGAKQYAASKLEGMRAAYEQQGGGMRGAMAATMTGIRSVAQDGFNFVDNLTGGKLSAIREKFSQGIQNVKNVITGAFSWFRQSGAKILTTFTEGIKSAISAPINAVKGALQKIRNMLPFSDAKTGPLSTLTLSGHRTMTTYATGLQQAATAPAEAVEGSLSRVNAQLNPAIPNGPEIPAPPKGPTPTPMPLPAPLPVYSEEPETVGIAATRAPVRTIERREVSKEKETNTTTSEKDTGVNINEFHLTVDFSKMKELPMLLKFLREIEDYANANGLATQGEG